MKVKIHFKNIYENIRTSVHVLEIINIIIIHGKAKI